MPGIDEETGFVLKIIGIYPRAEPRVRGQILVIDHRNGDLRYIIDASSATGWRTATATALAAKLLMSCDLGEKCLVKSLGVLGAGLQGFYHVRVFDSLFTLREIMLYDIDPSKINIFLESIKKISSSIYDKIRVVSRESLLENSDVVIAATSSRTPVIEGSRLRRNSIVLSIGAPRPVRELDEDTKRRARCALVDTIEGVLRESDDVSGIEIVEIGDFLRGARCVFGDIKLYKSVGTSLLDIAIAKYLVKQLEQ